MALIQEPSLVVDCVSGLDEVPDNVIYDLHTGKVRSCIYVKKGLHHTLLNFCSRNLAAIRLKFLNGGSSKELIFVSAYLSGDTLKPPLADEMENLVRSCEAPSLQKSKKKRSDTSVEMRISTQATN